MRAVLGLLDSPEASGQVFNIGNENEITIRALAERVRERAGSDSEIVVIPYDEAYGEGFEDMERRQPDTTKIREFLGWVPEKDIDEIIDGVIEYCRRGD